MVEVSSCYFLYAAIACGIFNFLLKIKHGHMNAGLKILFREFWPINYEIHFISLTLQCDSKFCSVLPLLQRLFSPGVCDSGEADTES